MIAGGKNVEWVAYSEENNDEAADHLLLCRLSTSMNIIHNIYISINCVTVRTVVKAERTD